MEKWLESFPQTQRIPLSSQNRSTSTKPSSLFGSGETKFYILAAEFSDTRPSWLKNSRSIVLLVSYKDFDLILTGDATEDTEKDIRAHFADEWLDCEVLKMGHHGSRITSTSDEWAKATRPEVSVACATSKRKHGHPGDDVVNRLAEHADCAPSHWLRVWRDRKHWNDLDYYKKAIYSTGTNGSIVVTTNGHQYDVTVARSKRPQW